MKALDLVFFDTFSVANGTKEIGLSYLKNSFSAEDNLTFAITGGADKDLFSIDATTGVLTFNEQAFVDTALDFDRDGIYDLQITVSGSDPGDTQTTNLGVEVAFDGTAPEISNLTITHEVNADNETVLTINARLTDEGSGMVDGTFNIWLKHSLTGEAMYVTNGGTVSIDEEGNLSLVYTMDASDPDGLWYIAYAQVTDKAGNAYTFNVNNAGTSLATAELPNALYLGSGGGSPNSQTDDTAPTVSDLAVTTYTEGGKAFIKVTGTATEENLNSLSFWFKVAGNPEAATIILSGYADRDYSSETYGYSYNASTGAFSVYKQLSDSNISGTYYLDQITTRDEADNTTNTNITNGSESPLFGLSLVIDNPIAVLDDTAPTVSDLAVTTYTEGGKAFIKVTGTATEENLNSLSFWFKVAGNPEAATIILSGYADRDYSSETYGYSYNASTGAFSVYKQLSDSNISGTYYLDQITTRDEADNTTNTNITNGSESPLFGLSVIITTDSPISIEITRNNATEIGEFEAINEGQFGASMGKITVNGNDALGLFDLTISGADAALLEISPLGYLRLKSSVSLDFDDQPNLSFTITATNTLGESFDARYTLSIVDLQLTPTAVLIDGVSETTVQIAENQVGALVGNLSTVDGDDADTHTYALSEQDSEIFEITPNNALKLKDGVSLNFEDQNSYTVTVTSTDSTGLSFSQTFAIEVTDINEAPTDITLASLNIPERLDGAEIGLITVSDVDSNESFMISVNDDRFEVVNNVLKLKDSVQLQFSQVEQVTLIVTVTDSGGNSLQESFTLLVGSIQLDVYAVDENVAGASVGALSVSDTSVTGNISYVLSGDDADQFEVVDGVLKLKSTASADFETKSSYSLNVTATGADNISVEATLIINVNDLNDAPTSVSVSGELSINENEEGASVGTLTTSDQDAGETFSYSISGADADLFEIVNNTLKLKASVAANYETQSTYSVTITSTDAAGLQVSNGFEIQVADMAEAATAIIISKEDPTPSPNSGEGETITVVVTVQAGQFYFNGELQSEFELIKGNTYIFEQSVGANGHVLGISATDGGASVAGLNYAYTTAFSNNPTTLNVSTYTTYLTNPAYVSFFSNYTFAITYTVPEDGTDTLYFFSASSAVTGGTFNVGSGYVPPTPVDPDAITINENELGALVGNLSANDEDAGDTHTYTLSGTDADLFEIVDGQLRLASNIVANYELKSSYSIIVTATDASGLSFSNSLVIYVSDVNEAPTGVLLSSLRVEDATDGFIVGDLSTVDQDTNDTYTYALTGDDADNFEVVDGQLKLKNGVAADYDTQSTYSVTVTSTDSGSETATQTFTLNVVTTINLTSFSFAENTAGVVVGDLSVTDENFSSNVTYTLSGEDGDQFEIVNNQLKLKDDVAANFEVKDAYAIVITVKDDAGLEAIINFSLSVTDQPDAPTAISLSQAEPEPPAPPPNSGEGETITVVVTVQAGQFYFNGELQSEFELIKGNTYIFEQSVGANGHVLGISATDGGASVAGLNYAYTTAFSNNPTTLNVSTYTTYLTNPAYVSFFSNYTFAITYTVPEDGTDTLYFFSASSAVTGGTFNVGSGYVPPAPPPTPVDPDAIVINENELGAMVGTLLTTDEDAGDTHTYTLSGADADLFEIVDGKLKLKDSIATNYENKSILNIEITATDQTGLSVTQSIAITVNNVNEQPTQINLSQTSFDEATAGAIVGTLNTEDEDIDDIYVYALSGTDADLFEVVEGVLKLKADIVADYETQNTYSVTLTSTDSGGLSVSQDFTLLVNNVNEPVTSITLGELNYVTVAEGEEGGVIGDFIINDPDLNETRTYLLTGRDAKYFEVVDGRLKVKSGVTLDYENLFFTAIDADGNILKVLDLTVTVIDSEGYTAKNNFNVYVSNANDAPYGLRLEGTGINNGQGTIAKIFVEDVDDTSFSFNVDNENFEIIDGYLVVKSGVILTSDLWEITSVSITVTDSANNTFSQSFELMHVSVDLDNYSFTENIENPVVAHINFTVKSEDFINDWTLSLSGSDARFFKINADNDIEFIGTGDYEVRSSYDLVISFIHSSGQSFESLQTIEVLDANDAPDLWYSHANDITFYDPNINAGSNIMFGVNEETIDPYILTLAFDDQDLNDSHSIQITYRPYSGYNEYDENGNWIRAYNGDPIDITDLFIFNADTGALFFNGSLDFESITGDYSGLNDSHRWHEPITITITDSSGASSSMTVLMNTWDNSSDGEFNMDYSWSYTNYNNPYSYSTWIGGLGDSDTDLWPQFEALAHGDINGDNIPDLVAWMTNRDYGYDVYGTYGALWEDYSYMRIALGGESSFPNFDGTGRNGYHDVFGQGQGSVSVILPEFFTNPFGDSPWGDVRYFLFEGLRIGDFNGDGKDDLILQLWSYIDNKDYLIIGYGQDFDNTTSNFMDLRNIFEDQTNGRVLDLTDYSENYLYLKDVGDLNGDGRDDIVLVEGGSDVVHIIRGTEVTTANPSSISLSIGLTEQDQNYGDFLGIAIGDFNGDGRLDLAVSSEMYDKNFNDMDDGGILIFLNGFNGNSSPDVEIVGYTSAQLGMGGIVSLGDINGDGYDDLGFSDDNSDQWIYWGNSNTFGTIDLTNFPEATNNISGFDVDGIYFDSVVAIGDINGDGYDDLAFERYDQATILYGMQNWNDTYFSAEGLNLLTITNTNSNAIFAIGDWDSDGKDEFVFARDSDLGFNFNNFLTIWQGDDPDINANGFSLSIEKNDFLVNENDPGVVVGSIAIIDNQDSNQYSYYINWVDADGTRVDNLWFDISDSGEITLKPGISLDADEYSSFSLRIFIIDNANDQISQHYINVYVNNINEASAFTLSNRMVDDTAAAGTVIGALVSTDAEGDEVTFALSGLDANMFVIDAETNEIRFGDDVNVDINSQVSFEITVTATDSFGLETSENISIEVNVAPTDLTLDTNLVQESVRGAAIGQLNVTDQNVSDEFTYAISGEDAWMFDVTPEGVLELSGNVFADFESKESISITITATDKLGKSISKDFTIYTKDINYSNPYTSDTITSNYVVPLSGDPIIDSLLFGFTLDPDRDFSTPLTVTYSIIDLDSTFFNDGPDGAVSGIEAPTESFISSIDEIFQYIGNLLGINFVKVEETADVVGDIRCGITNLPNASWGGICDASGFLAGNLDNVLFSSGSNDSDVWFNSASYDFNDVSAGSSEYSLLLHEIGHALGLKHPFQTFETTSFEDYFNSGYSMESIYDYFLDAYGYDLTFDDVSHLFRSIPQILPRLFNGLDWNAYSVMTYDVFPGQQYASDDDPYAAAGAAGAAVCGTCGQVHGHTHSPHASIRDVDSGISVEPSTFMSFDIYALMYIYRYDASTDALYYPDYNSGDTTYVIDGPVFMTIHDTGGVDTIDLQAFDFDIIFNMSFYGWTLDPSTGNYLFAYQHNEIGTNLLSYANDAYFSGYIVNASPHTEIENLILGAGNDTVYADFLGKETVNDIKTGDGNDSVFMVGLNDTISTGNGDDYVQAISGNFHQVDGGEGLDILSIDQVQLENGLFSIDFRNLSDEQIKGIEVLDYSIERVGGEGQILVSLQTFKSLGINELIIKATWQGDHEQAIGLQGSFKFVGSTDSYDIYTTIDAGQTFSLFVWKDHYVYQINDSILEISLSNNIVAEETWRFVGEISLSGEAWINPAGSLYSMDFTAIYTLSGDDAEMFEIIGDQLYFISQPDFETKSSYSVTITGLSLSGKTISKTFIIEVKDVDEASYTTGDDVISGTDSSDYLFGSSGNDTISGGEGDDNLTGGSGNDILRGDAGNDSLFGWGGEDEIYGGSGDDLIYGHEDTDKLYGDEGKDTIYGWDGDDGIEGGSNDDEIYGGSGNDIIFGDSETGEQDSDGNDSIDAGSGNDEVWGRGGDDIIYGGAGVDSLRGGSGNDVIRGGEDNDVIVGQSGDDSLSGDGGNDIIYGDRETGDSSDDGSDILWGGFGDDELYGRGGDDYLIGQNGLDSLTGGEGADTFVLTSYSGASSQDIIKDYVDGTDKIGLINIDFDSLVITQDANALDTNIADADGNIIAILEGVTATDIDAGDFVSLDYDLSEILEIAPSMVNLDLFSGLDADISLETNDAASAFANNLQTGSSLNEVKPASTSSSFNANAMISGDLIDSLIDRTEDLSFSSNDFI